MNSITFPTSQPTSIVHARALTLKAAGEEALGQMSEVLRYDNYDGFDLNPAKGQILISAAGGESQSDIAISTNEAGEVVSADTWSAPGAEGLPFEKFSYRKDAEAGTRQYSFTINGSTQTVVENTQNGTITAEFA